jgi:hypothetical protein
MIASQTLHVAPYGIVLVAGFLIGTFGHIIKSRTMILTGLVVIGLVSAYFAFVTLKIR